MFILIFIALEIVKHNVQHFPGVAEFALVVSLVIGILELVVYGFVILGTLLGFYKVGKKIK